MSPTRCSGPNGNVSRQARRKSQSLAQSVTALGNDLLSGYVHDCQGALQLHFHTLELSDELVESRGTRLACSTGVIGHTVVREVEYPAALKTGGLLCKLLVEELNQGS